MRILALMSAASTALEGQEAQHLVAHRVWTLDAAGENHS